MKKTVFPSKEQLNLAFRPIEPSDTIIVAQIIRQVMTEFGCVGEGYSINDPEIDDMFTAYDNEKSSFWVLMNPKGIVVGCGGVAPLKNGSSDTCELQKMYFLPSARGRGYGRKFLSFCLEKAKKMGYQKCYLETVARMEGANALYQKMGFQKLSTIMGDTGHCSCDAHYVRQL